MERALALVCAGAALLFAGSCAAPQKVAVPPAPAPAPRPSPAPLPPPPADWRDAPQTAGDWRWGLVDGRSTASYGLPGAAPLVTLTCDRPNARVLIARRGTATGAVPMALRSTARLRPLTRDPLLGSPGMVTAELGVRDPALDAVAFSRGRFALETAGDRKSTRLNSSHGKLSRMPSSA